MSAVTFSSLGLDNWIANKLCDKIGYKRPSKIQKLAIPDIL
jgi:superfamily II DNA/RNA helicase